MAQYTESEALREAEHLLNYADRVVKRAEHRFTNGSNHFMARTALASMAPSFTFDSAESRDYAFVRANEGIVAMLQRNQAEGEVYAVREDLGNGKQDSTDFVRVTKRGGIATNADRRSTSQEYVIRGTTYDTTTI